MKGIIFDLDGTLVDSMHCWRSLTEDFLKLRDKVVTKDFQNRATAMSLRSSAFFLKEYYSLKESPDEIYGYFENRVKEFYLNEVPLKKGAKEVLEYFAKDHPLCLGTSTAFEFAQIVLEKFDLKKYFKYIATADELGFTKDNPKFYAETLKKINMDKSQVSLVDDSVLALRTANNFGIKTIGIYDKNSDYTWDQIISENDFHILSLEELIGLDI